MKKIISLILAFVLAFSMLSLTASAAVKTECKGDCEHCPSIVVPGIGQSNVWALDENGDYLLDDNGERISCFPAIFDVGSIVKTVLGPVLLTLITQHDVFLSDALCDVVLDAFEVNNCDPETGKNTGNIEVEKYPYSVAECSDYEKGEIYDNIPLQAYSEIAGEDHLYYFAYNSFGNNLDIVNELYAFIQMVKAETGHDKVNIVPISMGGSVANGLFEYYPEVVNDLNKVVYIVPALNGSTIVGDLYTKNLAFLNTEFLYNGFLETLMDEEEARMIEVIARILPDEVLTGVLTNVANCLVEDVAANITMLWGLCPKEYYPAASNALLGSKPEIKKQTDKFYKAQLNSLSNIQKLVDNGVQVFDIVDYDAPLYQIGNSWNNDNADGVIHLSSTAMGVHSALVGETLGEGYKQANTSVNCSNPAHNHISPDNVVDASTGLLPDTTFYFDGQNHERTARNDIIISLATKLLATDDIKDVYSTPDYPQFNGARDPRDIKNNLLPAAKAVDASALNAADATELAAAIAEAEAFVNGTVCYDGQEEKIEERLKAILVKVGAREAEVEEEPSTFFTELSLWLYDNYGANGYSEMLPLTINLIAKTVSDFLNEYILAPFFG
ncbi:MAG: hypothetical protein IJZ07_01290 [Clostridia bacterium]|nr:hypothetical protein [Clostridia bacterium]